MNGAQAFVSTLREFDVDTFFGLPGSTEAPLLEALREDGAIRYVLSLHEGVAVAMADGYARAAGKPGVVGLHTTVGTMNGMSQLFNSSRDAIPVVMTAGHKDRAVLAEDGFCSFPDLASLMRPFTKSSRQTLSPEQVAPDLARALLAATTPPTGPTFLAVPEDLMAASLSADLDRRALPGIGSWTGGKPDPASVERVAAMLLRSRRPLMVLGTAAALATPAAVRLAETVGCAVVAADLTDLGAVAYPADGPGFLGAYGDEPLALEGCDLVLAVGCRVFYPFSDRLRPRLPAGADLVHIHPDPAELGRRLRATVGWAGDPGTALASLLDACLRLEPELGSAAARTARVEGLRRARRERLGSELEAARGANPVAVPDLAAEIARVLPRGTILVEESVRGSRLVFRHCGVPRGGELWRSSGGALGWGLPAAVGAKLARPDRPVVLLVGDGTLHFSVQALWTAVAQGAPVVVVVLDNGGYLAVKRAIENLLQLPTDPRTHPGTELPGLDHLSAARAYGAQAVLASTATSAAAAVEAALAAEAVQLVTVPVARIRP